MKRRIPYYLIIILSILSACSKKSVETELYQGPNLTIGMIGEIPNVREENVEFTEIQLSDLEEELFTTPYDAIMITKDFLSEAAEAKYAPIYKKTEIPFFFIQNNKSYVPFIQEDLSYEDVPILDDHSYATGLLYEGDKLLSWGYGLYNNIENEENIEDIYTRIFITIQENFVGKKETSNFITQEGVYSYDLLKEWDEKEYERTHSQKLSYFSAPIQSPYKYMYHTETVDITIDEIANALGTIMMEDFMQDYEGKTFVVTGYKNLSSHVFDEAEQDEWEERNRNSGKNVIIEENQWICSFECDYKYTGVYCDIGTMPSDMEWMNTLITDGSGENYVFIIQKVDDDDYIMGAAPKTLIERKSNKN